MVLSNRSYHNFKIIVELVAEIMKVAINFLNNMFFIANKRKFQLITVQQRVLVIFSPGDGGGGLGRWV